MNFVRPVVHVTNQDVELSMYGYDFTVPKGTRLTHMTAMGADPLYNYVNEFDWISKDWSGLKHDAMYYGINIKPEFVLEYEVYNLLYGHQELVFKKDSGYVGGSTLKVGDVIEHSDKKMYEITKVVGYHNRYYNYDARALG